MERARAGTPASQTVDGGVRHLRGVRTLAPTRRLSLGNLVLPAEFPKSGVSPGKIDAQVLETNAVRVTSAAEKVTVWLAPEIVDFSGKVTVTINGRRQLNIVPDVSVLLEDVRSRGDRQHPFWARVDHGQ